MYSIDKLTTALGLGLFYGIKFEWLHKSFNNMTLGLHGQEWEAECDYAGTTCDLNEIYIGFFLFRFVLQFVSPNDK